MTKDDNPSRLIIQFVARPVIATIQSGASRIFQWLLNERKCRVNLAKLRRRGQNPPMLKVHLLGSKSSIGVLEFAKFPCVFSPVTVNQKLHTEILRTIRKVMQCRHINIGFSPSTFGFVLKGDHPSTASILIHLIDNTLTTVIIGYQVAEMKRPFDGFKLESTDAPDTIKLIDNIFHAAGHCKT